MVLTSAAPTLTWKVPPPLLSESASSVAPAAPVVVRSSWISIPPCELITRPVNVAAAPETVAVDTPELSSPVIVTVPVVPLCPAEILLITTAPSVSKVSPVDVILSSSSPETVMFCVELPIPRLPSSETRIVVAAMPELIAPVPDSVMSFALIESVLPPVLRV